MTSTIETEDVVERVTRWIESEKASIAKRGSGHSLVAISMKVADIEALLALSATPIERLREENARLMGLVRAYVDPFDVSPSDHALALAIGTDDEKAYRAALTPSADDDK